MNQMTVKEAAAKWGITPRQVQLLCATGRKSSMEASYLLRQLVFLCMPLKN